MADVLGMAGWLCELVDERRAKDDNSTDFSILLDNGQLAIVSLEETAVYLVTVQEAQFTPVSNTGSEPK